MKKWSSIGQYRNVVKTIQLYHERTEKEHLIPTVDYVGTVKLHGTNCGVRRTPSGKIQCQSRERIISNTDDNYGFTKFIEAIPEPDLRFLFHKVSPNPKDDITIYGEWVGKGIQGGTGVSQLEKHWVIFGAWVNEEYVKNDVSWQTLDHRIFNILDIPTYEITVDFKDPEAVVEELQRITHDVEECCPWAKCFGVEGIGEGVVWVRKGHPHLSDYWFKVKGQKHSGKSNKEKKTVTVDPQKVESIEQYVALVVTHERLVQGLEHLKEMNIDFEMKNMGKYLKWVNQDVQKEEMDTLEANELEWKDVVKQITSKAKTFYMDKLNEF